MVSNLERSISESELAYLRRTYGERSRMSLMMAMLWLGALALGALVSGGLMFSYGGYFWGSLLLGIGAALVLLGVWLVRRPDDAQGMSFRPVLVSGPLASAIEGVGKMKEKVYYLGADPVVFPSYWLRTLKQMEPLRARAALPEGVPAPSRHVPCLVLEIEGGPSVAFERAQVPTPLPLLRPWATLALVLSGFGAFGLLAGTLDSERSRDQVARSVPALRAAFGPVARFADAAAFAAAPPAQGRVRIESAWQVEASDLKGAPLSNGVFVLTQAARDRILAARRQELPAYEKADAAYQQVYAAYRARWPLDRYEGLPGHPVQQRPPPPPAPHLPDVRFDPNDVVAFVPGASLSFAAGGVDEISKVLAAPGPVAGEIYAHDRPLVLVQAQEADNWREAGVACALGLVCLVVFGVVGGVLLQDFQQRQALLEQIRAAYAHQGRRLL